MVCQEDRDEEGPFFIQVLSARNTFPLEPPLCFGKFPKHSAVLNKNPSLLRAIPEALGSFRNKIPKRHTVGPVLVTTFGLDYNEYSGFFQNVVTMEDLFG